MKRLVGIDLNGVVDRVTAGHATGAFGTTDHAYGASVAFPNHRRERPLVAAEATHVRDGLGWVGAAEARWWVRDGLDQLREARVAAPVPGPHGTSHAVGELVGRHVLGLLEGSAERVVVTMPEVWVDVGQQALLDGMGTLRPRTELLWRPVATLLALGEQLEPPFREGCDVFQVHLGPDVPEVATYEVTWETMDGRRFLVPVRSGPGRALKVPPIHRDVLERWWHDTAGRAAVRVDDVRALSVGWRSAVGELGAIDYVRRNDGHWVAIPSGLDARAVELYAETLAAAIAEQVPPRAIVVLEGATGNAMAGERSVAAIVMARLRASNVASAVLTVPRDAASLGAFVYALRRHHGWPTYLDVLPSLSIQALVDGRPRFVELVSEGQRVAGGTTYEGDEVGGFAVATGTEKLTYYLSRGDEPTVRSTETQLKLVPSGTVPLALRVRQKPAQGYAEVRIAATDASSWPPVLLDWSTMTDTVETRDELLERLEGEQGYAYPSVEPFPASVELWRYHDVDRVLGEFLVAEPAGRDYGQRLEKLVGAMRMKGSPDALRTGIFAGTSASHGVINSCGSLPEDGDDAARRRDRAASFQALLNKVASDFNTVRSARSVDEAARRRLMLLGAWCYVAAPANVVAFARNELRSYVSPGVPGTEGRRYAANLAERSFQAKADMALLFEVAESLIDNGRLKMQWIKASAYLFRFREDAPHALDRSRATRLARVAIRTMKDHASAGNVQQKFFVAARLLVGLLRVRMVDPSFLTPDDPTTGRLLDDGKSVLIQARRAASGIGRERIVGLVDAIDDYLEGHGTEALIFSKLEAMGGDG